MTIASREPSRLLLVQGYPSWMRRGLVECVVFSAILIVNAASVQAAGLDDKLDNIARFAPGPAGFVNYRALDSIDKHGLIIAAKHRHAGLREAALLHLKSRYVGELTSADIETVSASIFNGETRECMAAGSLLGARLDRSRRILIKALRGKRDLAAVCAAAGFLDSSPSAEAGLESEALTRMLDCLVRCEGDESNVALNYLINHPRPAALPWFEKTLSDSSLREDARRNAATAWVYFANKDTVPFAIRLLQDGDPRIRASALGALRGRIDDAMVPELLKVRGDESASVRRQLFEILREAKVRAAAPALIAALSDEDDEVFAAAAGGIEELSVRAALPRLVEVLRNGERGHGKLSGKEMAAGRAIARLTGKDFKFGGVGFCGNMFDGADLKIAQGRYVGGEKGRALIEEGEREIAETRASTARMVADSDKHNMAERKRLLKWWDSPAARKFPHR